MGLPHCMYVLADFSNDISHLLFFFVIWVNRYLHICSINSQTAVISGRRRLCSLLPLPLLRGQYKLRWKLWGTAAPPAGERRTTLPVWLSHPPRLAQHCHSCIQPPTTSWISTRSVWTTVARHSIWDVDGIKKLSLTCKLPLAVRVAAYSVSSCQHWHIDTY